MTRIRDARQSSSGKERRAWSVPAPRVNKGGSRVGAPTASTNRISIAAHAGPLSFVVAPSAVLFRLVAALPGAGVVLDFDGLTRAGILEALPG